MNTAGGADGYIGTESDLARIPTARGEELLSFRKDADVVGHLKSK